MEQALSTHRRLPINPGLLALIRGKREWHWRPSVEELRDGFRGWHQRGYLPHFDAPYVTQIVTFMLCDSFPIAKRAEWEPILHEADESEKRKKLERWLDRGHGECWLRKPAIAEIIEGVLSENNRRAYELRAWVVMPNHVHLVVDVWRVPLAKLLSSWKGKSARLANLHLKRSGAFWQEDSFDTLIRNEDHLRKAIHYTEYNPSKAALVKDPREWLWGSACRRDAQGRLA